MKLSNHNSFGESHSWRLGRALRASPVYPVFEDEKSRGSDENRSGEKLHKNHRTNLLATNSSLRAIKIKNKVKKNAKFLFRR